MDWRKQMLITNGQILVRKMQYSNKDFFLLFKWLNNKKLLSFIEGPSSKFTKEQIIKKYGPRAKGEHYVTPCIIEFNSLAIGYLQFYPLQEAEILEYGVKADKKQFGLDLFIGETNYWHQGIGTTVLKLMIQYLFTKQGAVDIYVDPQTWNTRAIKSYQKCGFKKLKVLREHELFDGNLKDNQLMRRSLDKPPDLSE
ncbi:GNAT family N-acetyltransferase [Sporolactobacillus shoreae]|uniref:GNAT family N-acetyltransferase n=2 Tax=Sporolactobacillus shoreae TaxID=1465501 RepID=A0A4Z0GGQ1_9BACL|nr:GNAT family N-acetyltransferase [Sporolactobacillus shoreae]